MVDLGGQRYSGAIMGMSNTLASVPGFVGSTATGTAA